MQPANCFLGHTYADPDLCFRILLPQLSERFPKLIDESGYPGGKVKGGVSFATSFSNSCLIWWVNSTRVLACSARRRAAGVGIRRLPLRTNSSVWSSSARLCNWRLTAPGDKKTFSAARVMLGESITARKSSSWWISIGPLTSRSPHHRRTTVFGHSHLCSVRH